MSKKVIIRKSIRLGKQGPRLRIHIFINGFPAESIIFTSNETKSIYNMIAKHLASYEEFNKIP